MNLSEKYRLFVINELKDELKDELKTKELSLFQIFGNTNPIYLEIGSGRGEFILQKAKQNPQINFLGIDSKEKRIKTILRNMTENSQNNLRLFRSFVDKETMQIFPDAIFSKVYILHPDPWPKRKHHRRRLINQGFLNVLSQKMKINAEIELATDHREYADWIIHHFSRRQDFASNFENGFTKIVTKDHIPTYFENKKKAEGFQPIFMKFQKQDKK